MTAGAGATRRLLVDTAGPLVGVAAWRGDALVYAAEARIVQGADGWLTPALSDALDALGGLEEVGVTVGPGAFTGLRVGVSAALGLAVARRASVVAVSSLALRAAWGLTRCDAAWILALLDAKKDRVYAGRFWRTEGGPVPDGVEVDVAPDVAFAGPVGFAVGEGAVRYRAEAEAAGWAVTPDADASPVTSGLALLLAGLRVPPERIACEYLRGADVVPPRR